MGALLGHISIVIRRAMNDNRRFKRLRQQTLTKLVSDGRLDNHTKEEYGRS